MPRIPSPTRSGLTPHANRIGRRPRLSSPESAKPGFEKGLITPVLVGEEVTIRKTANRIDWDISKLRVVDTTSETETSDTAAALARDGCVTALMKGQIHTDNFMLGILKKEFGLRTGRRLTHIFHMTIPGSDRPLMITDGAVNVAPNVDTRLQAAQNAIDLAHALGNKNPSRRAVRDRGKTRKYA